MLQIFGILLFLSLSSHARGCADNQSVAELKTMASQLVDHPVYQCFEQEVVDSLLDHWRLQDYVLKECDKESRCLAYLRNKVVEFSNLEVGRFKNYKSIQLWSELYKYSGLFRKIAPSLSELPIDGDPIAQFEKLQSAKLASRDLNQSETKKVICSAVVAIVGPGKVKGAKAVIAAVKTNKIITSIEITHDVSKVITHNRLPPEVLKNFRKWQDRVKSEGLLKVRETPGYHDEIIKTQPGARSVRMKNGYRVFYTIEKNSDDEVIKVYKISMHEY